jgi:hypothetical protein
MNQQTNQTADQPTSHPADQPTSHPADQPTNHPRKKKRHVATWIALASAVTAIAAAAISGYQVHIAGQQNTQSEQTQLVNLTTMIAQQFADSGNNQVTRTSAAQSILATKLQGRVELLSVYGQAGAVLIQDLNGNGVASMEYIEVGRALDYTGDTAGAIPYYKDALIAPPHAPYTRAQAMRYLGFLYYGLGSNMIAHRYMMRATKVYGRHPLEYKSGVANTIAQGYVEDADWQIYINCRTAAADMEAGQRVLGSYSADAVTQTFLNIDEKNYAGNCNGSG